jgi:hypothetical protein
MKPMQKSDSDRIKLFMSPAEIESAPEGFTDKIMIQIRMEPVSVHSTTKNERNLIPFISACITAFLVLIALLLPGTESYFPDFNWTDKLDKISSILPEINLPWTFSMSLPEIMAYVTISIFLLLILDRTLSRYFHQGT